MRVWRSRDPQLGFDGLTRIFNQIEQVDWYIHISCRHVAAQAGLIISAVSQRDLSTVNVVVIWSLPPEGAEIIPNTLRSWL
jgi:hypothetical protein